MVTREAVGSSLKQKAKLCVVHTAARPQRWRGKRRRGHLQQRKMARSGRADTAAVLTARAVTSTNTVQPSSEVRQAKKQKKTRSEGKEKGRLTL